MLDKGCVHVCLLWTLSEGEQHAFWTLKPTCHAGGMAFCHTWHWELSFSPPPTCLSGHALSLDGQWPHRCWSPGLSPSSNLGDPPAAPLVLATKLLCGLCAEFGRQEVWWPRDWAVGWGPRAHTHLPQRPGQAAELVGCIDGHHGHGGCGDGPAQCVGPCGKDVVSIVWGPEGHDADHDHKLKPRAEVRRALAQEEWVGGGVGARGLPATGPGARALQRREPGPSRTVLARCTSSLFLV